MVALPRRWNDVFLLTFSVLILHSPSKHNSVGLQFHSQGLAVFFVWHPSSFPSYCCLLNLPSVGHPLSHPLLEEQQCQTSNPTLHGPFLCLLSLVVPYPTLREISTYQGRSISGLFHLRRNAGRFLLPSALLKLLTWKTSQNFFQHRYSFIFFEEDISV